MPPLVMSMFQVYCNMYLLLQHSLLLCRDLLHSNVPIHHTELGIVAQL